MPARIECEPDVTIDLLQMFRKHNACPAERVHRLSGTPRMKELTADGFGAAFAVWPADPSKFEAM
jgi:hypothetical protein